MYNAKKIGKKHHLKVLLIDNHLKGGRRWQFFDEFGNGQRKREHSAGNRVHSRYYDSEKFVNSIDKQKTCLSLCKGIHTRVSIGFER